MSAPPATGCAAAGPGRGGIRRRSKPCRISQVKGFEPRRTVNRPDKEEPGEPRRGGPQAASDRGHHRGDEQRRFPPHPLVHVGAERDIARRHPRFAILSGACAAPLKVCRRGETREGARAPQVRPDHAPEEEDCGHDTLLPGREVQVAAVLRRQEEPEGGLVVPAGGAEGGRKRQRENAFRRGGAAGPRGL